MQELRDDLLNLLADVEAGLDFADEDIHFVGQEDLLKRLGKGTGPSDPGEQAVAAAGRVRSRLPRGAGRPTERGQEQPVQRPRRRRCPRQPATGNDARLPRPALEDRRRRSSNWSTRRAGRAAPTPSKCRRKTLAREQSEHADLVLLCLEAGRTDGASETELLARSAAAGRRCCDQVRSGQPPPDCAADQRRDRDGPRRLEARCSASERAIAAQPALAPSLSRCRHHVEACLEHLRRAHAIVLYEDPPELLALELRGAWSNWARWSARSIPMICWTASSAGFASGNEMPERLDLE